MKRDITKVINCNAQQVLIVANAKFHSFTKPALLLNLMALVSICSIVKILLCFVAVIIVFPVHLNFCFV